MRGAVLLLLAVASCVAQSLPDFAGTWVQKWEGRNFRVLKLRLEGATLAGSVAQPKSFSWNQDGDLSKLSPQHATFSLQKLTQSGSRLEFTFEDDRYAMTLVDRDHAELLPLDDDYPLPPWKLERSADESISVANSWPPLKYPPNVVALQNRLQRMIDADQKVRLAPKMSFPAMERIDRRHLAEVLRIHATYGWPRISIVGREASHNYWLLVQHQDLAVQQKILPDLERAANSGEASKSDFAYLYDRVQVRHGKPQRWGTQVSCKQGKPVLDAVEEPSGLDQRRRALSMMPIERYLKEDYLLRTCAEMPGNK
ncbi:MAG TPA: DUF6624 domain-containing protein [Candidatus Solibacter sp.]